MLREFFDGFLYWANWGSPELAFRFPHGILPADLIADYDFDDFVTFTQYKDYDILDIHFGEMEGPDEWIDYELGSLIPIRDELMEGDLRALYITWLASQCMMFGYEEDQEEEDYEIIVPPVPPDFGKLTGAQQALAELLQVPEELLAAASRHSFGTMPSAKKDDFATWVNQLPVDRKDEYLLRLAHNESGLSHLFVRELRGSNREKDRVRPLTGERVTYATLNSESKAIKVQLEHEKRERKRAEHLRHLQDIYEHQELYWQQVDQAVERGSGSGYDEAINTLIELREATSQFKESEAFQGRFLVWVRPHLRRPAFVKRLQLHKFAIPEA